MLNQIVLMGRLTRDPELRYTQSQIPVCSFRIAVDRDFANSRDGSTERQADFIDIVAWRQSAEFVSKYFTKGSMIIVTGRLQMRDWTDRDGNKRTSAEVQADRVMFGETKRSREENAGAYRAPAQGGGNYGGGSGNPSGGYGGNHNYGGGNSYGGNYGNNNYGGGGGYGGAPAQGGGYASLNDMPDDAGFSELADSDGELPF